MAHPIYRPHIRQNNQALIKALVQPAGENAMMETCRAHQRDFSPSLYLELDWQRFRPDLADADLKRILDFIVDLLFVVGFPTNLAAREDGTGTIRLNRSESSRLEPIFDVWQDVWCRPEGPAVLADFDRFVESLRTPPRRALETKIREDVLERLDEALAKLTDLSNLASIVDQILVNAQFAFLDLPWTRRAVRASLAAQSDSKALISIFPAGFVEWLDPRAIALQLRRRANDAGTPGAEEWAALLCAAADRIADVDAAGLVGDDGDWTTSCCVCGECAMWFAGRTIAAMDDRMSYAQSSGKNFIYLPSDLMVCRCPFCGFAAPNNVATFFFAEQRGQVIYLVPTNDAVSATEAISFWADLIEQRQKRYLGRRDETAAERFWAASELMTHDVVKFFYAVQMGETIVEDHVFNIISMTDGSALIFDGEKRFARVITAGEARMLRATHRVEEDHADTADGQALRTLTPEEADQLVREMAAANDSLVFSPRRRDE